MDVTGHFPVSYRFQTYIFENLMKNQCVSLLWAIKALKPDLLHKFGSLCSHCYLINFVTNAIPHFLSDFKKCGRFRILE